MTDIRSMEKRFREDPQFNQLVTALENMIEKCQFTPTEIREAAMYAAIRADYCRLL